jgi:uncharacterized protein (TIGR02597 family)
MKKHLKAVVGSIGHRPALPVCRPCLVLGAGFLFLVSGLGSSRGQSAEVQVQTLRTAPVGLANLRVPGRSARALSFPLANPAVFTGTIASSSNQVLTNSLAAWTKNQWGPFAVNPHVVRLLDGDSAGRTFRIHSNTSNSIILEDGAAGVLEEGQAFEVLPVDTLAGVFGPEGAGLGVHIDPAQADQILIHEGKGWATYYNDGSKWLRVGAGDSVQNSTALLPDEGIFFIRKSASPLQLSLLGEVFTTQTASELPGGAHTFLANPFPVNLRLAELQLQEDPSWREGPDAGSADLVHLHNGKTWTVYFHDGKNWRNKAGRIRNPVVSKGAALFIERHSGGDILHSPTPPYRLP